MANSEKFLTQPAAQPIGTQEIFIEKVIDFSVENLAAAGTMDIIKLPKGTIITHFGMRTVTVNTDDSATLAIGLKTLTQALRSAAVLGAAGTFVCLPITAGVLITAEDAIRLTGAVATLAQAKIHIIVKYVVSDLYRN